MKHTNHLPLDSPCVCAAYTLLLGCNRIQRAVGFFRSPQLERQRLRFLRHAGKSVFLGRFVAVLRVLAGPMAGAVGMPYRRFLLCNAAGAVLWASTMVGLAWLGGRWIPLERMLRGLVEFGLGLLLLAVLIVLVPRWLAWWEQRQLDPNNGP